MAFFSISKLVAKSAVSKPATRLYPFEKREIFPHTRGRIEINIDSCVFCNLCAKKCPTGAIVCNRKDKSWAIDHTKCILCGNCVGPCPKGSLIQRNTPAPPMLKHEIDFFQAKTQSAEELEAELAAKGAPPAGNDACCSNE